MDGNKTPFDIRPGETTSLSLGTSNYLAVTARVVWPAGDGTAGGLANFRRHHHADAADTAGER